MKNKFTLFGSTITSIGVLAIVIFVLILSPFLYFAISWLVGWLIKVTFGTTFIKGLEMLHINISKDQIPLFCGVIGTIGSFFKSNISNNTNH